MKISIVTPSYNSELYIEDCINSVLNQNYENFEHVIIDGGSTDGTLNILKKYPHLIWISEKDEGQSDALNKGFRLANGDIIGWCNSDDIYLPNTFEKVITLLESNKIDGVYSNLYFGDEKLNITKKLISHRAIKWLSLFHCFIPSASFFFKKKIILDGIRIDKKLTIVMDKDFFANLLFNNYSIKYIDDFFSVFRWHNSNKSIDTSKVKRIRASEGLLVFNKYSKIKMPNNVFFARLYLIVASILLIYRFALKIIKI